MSRQTSYSPQIDALRAIAIVVVMLHHYITGPFLFAGFGVVMFFMLSGYFATYGLLRLKVKLEAQALTPWQALCKFYQRRYTRIVPLYFLVLAGASIFGVAYARETLLWNACFLSNFAILHTGEWTGRFSQLWSLSVLEQFYLVWPAAILFLPRRYLVALSLCGIAAAIGWRIVCQQANFSPFAWTVMPFGGLDQLCTGALLSLAAVESSSLLRQRLMSAGRISVILFALLIIGRAMGIEAPYSAFYLPLVASLAFAWILDGARQEYGGWAGRILSMPLLCHCGRISFAAFLLHNLTELMLPRTPFMRHLMTTNYRFLVLVPFTFLVADVVWRFLENPLLCLREGGWALRRAWWDPLAGWTGTAQKATDATS